MITVVGCKKQDEKKPETKPETSVETQAETKEPETKPEQEKKEVKVPEVKDEFYDKEVSTEEADKALAGTEWKMSGLAKDGKVFARDEVKTLIEKKSNADVKNTFADVDYQVKFNKTDFVLSNGKGELVKTGFLPKKQDKKVLKNKWVDESQKKVLFEKVDEQALKMTVDGKAVIILAKVK